MTPVAVIALEELGSVIADAVKETKPMSILIPFLISQLATILLGEDVLPRILGAVERWDEKKIAGAEKRVGVLNELEVIGLKLSESAANLGVELAVQYLKAKAPADANK